MAAQGPNRSVHGQRAIGIHEQYQKARTDTEEFRGDRKSLARTGRKIVQAQPEIILAHFYSRIVHMIITRC